MKILSFCVLMLAVCCLSFQGATPYSAVSKNEIQQNKMPEFYLADMYSQEINFVKFATTSTSDRKRTATSYIYKSDDSRYKDWTVTYAPNNRATQQWSVQEPKTNRAPNGGGYCVTTRCFCESWGYYVVSCYSKCTEEECCQMFLDFKRC